MDYSNSIPTVPLDTKELLNLRSQARFGVGTESRETLISVPFMRTAVWHAHATHPTLQVLLQGGRRSSRTRGRKARSGRAFNATWAHGQVRCLADCHLKTYALTHVRHVARGGDNARGTARSRSIVTSQPNAGQHYMTPLTWLLRLLLLGNVRKLLATPTSSPQSPYHSGVLREAS